MPEFLVREAQSEDLDGYFEVCALTYNDGNPIPPERRGFDGKRAFVARQQGEIQGSFNILDLSCTRGEATYPCGGVAAVATLPHRRRMGVGSAMMSWIPGHLHAAGVPLSSLYAFREPFYRRFGWEVVGRRMRITCPIHRLPKTSSGLTLRRLGPGDWREIDACYSAFARARSGLCMRTEKLWGRVLGENRPLTVYAAGAPAEAYAVVSHTANFWTTDQISDLAWSTMRGYEAMLETFAGLGINKTALSWLEPSDGPFYARYLDQGVEAKLDRPVMFRVCDVPGALRGLRPKSSGRFSLRVVDALVPENEGPWNVTFTPEGVEVIPTSSAEMTIDIRHFTQAFLGEPSLFDLARSGILDSDGGALQAAGALLTALPVLCNDFF